MVIMIINGFLINVKSTLSSSERYGVIVCKIFFNSKMLYVHQFPN